MPEPAQSTCAAVTFDMRDEHYGESAADANLGDLLWNPKAGDGHILVREAPCDGGRTADCGCGGWVGPCSSTVLICECGQDDSWRDHHYEILARAGSDQIQAGPNSSKDLEQDA